MRCIKSITAGMCSVTRVRTVGGKTFNIVMSRKNSCSYFRASLLKSIFICSHTTNYITAHIYNKSYSNIFYTYSLSTSSKFRESYIYFDFTKANMVNNIVPSLSGLYYRIRYLTVTIYNMPSISLRLQDSTCH